MIQLVPITALYAALCALLILILAGHVAILRRQTRTGSGDGGHQALSRAIRVHGNAVEYIPVILLLSLLLELNGASGTWLHALGSTLIVARVLHAWGLSHSSGLSFGRWYGTGLTWLVLIGAAGLNLTLLFL